MQKRFCLGKLALLLLTSFGVRRLKSFWNMTSKKVFNFHACVSISVKVAVSESLCNKLLSIKRWLSKYCMSVLNLILKVSSLLSLPLSEITSNSLISAHFIKICLKLYIYTYVYYEIVTYTSTHQQSSTCIHQQYLWKY